MRVDATGYVSHMTYDEKNLLTACLKPIKTYDYAYIKPHELGSSVIAIRARSCIAIMNIPYKLSGILCISLKALMNMDRAMPKENPTPDIYFPDLNTTLQKYIYVAQAELPYIFEDNDLVFIQAYHMIRPIFDIVTTFESYKQIVELYQNFGIIKEYDIDSVSMVVNEISALRADDGGKMIALDPQHIITIFSGMLPLNKADKLSIKLYDNTYKNFFMVSYIIEKKKMDPIEVMFFYMRV